MSGTKPAGEALYGALTTTFPGRRDQAEGFNTSVGKSATVLAANATVNEAQLAVDVALKKERVVTSVKTGLVTRKESGTFVPPPFATEVPPVIPPASPPAPPCHHHHYH